MRFLWMSPTYCSYERFPRAEGSSSRRFTLLRC
jgi:hypothetical protein